jgi:DNA-binding transcriptional LysR family regulator
MEISQLKALVALRETESLAKVGEKLHLSPSAIFCQIRQLEDELGKKLYERFGKRLQLTETGERVAEYGRKILETHDAAVDAAKGAAGLTRGLVRIGCGPHSSHRVAPPLIKAFLSEYPNTEVRVVTSGDESLLRDLKRGFLDVVMLTLPVGDAALVEEPLFSYSMVFVLPPSSDGRKPAGIAEIRDRPFILYRRAVLIDAILQQAFRELSFVPKVLIENDEPDSIIEFVRLGVGIAILPAWSVADEARCGTLRIQRLRTHHLHNYGLLWRTSGYQPKVLNSLIESARRWREWWPLARFVSDPV